MSLIHVPSVELLLNRVMAMSERSKLQLEEYDWSLGIYCKATALLAFFEEAPDSQTYFVKLAGLMESLENRPKAEDEKGWKELSAVFRRRYDMEIIRGQERAIQQLANPRRAKASDAPVLRVRRRDKLARWFSRK